jgi:hypothetical protein
MGDTADGQCDQLHKLTEGRSASSTVQYPRAHLRAMDTPHRLVRGHPFDTSLQHNSIAPVDTDQLFTIAREPSPTRRGLVDAYLMSF